MSETQQASPGAQLLVINKPKSRHTTRSRRFGTDANQLPMFSFGPGLSSRRPLVDDDPDYDALGGQAGAW
jgi:hypothetical protein